MVASVPDTVTLGEDIEATTFTLRISDTNVNVDPDCPSDVRSCLNVLWTADGHVYGIGYGEAVRLYLFTLGTGSDARTIVISLDAPDDTAARRDDGGSRTHPAEPPAPAVVGRRSALIASAPEPRIPFGRSPWMSPGPSSRPRNSLDGGDRSRR